MNSITQILDHHCAAAPDRILYRYLKNGEQEHSNRTFNDLKTNGLKISNFIIANGFEGQNIILAFNNPLLFMDAFIGCLYGNSTAVPVAVPAANRSAEKLAAIARDANSTLLLLSRQDGARLFSDSITDICQFAYIEDILSAEYCPAEGSVPTNDLSFIQYTSGSTGFPKGVLITHANLLHNLEMTRTAMQLDESMIIVSWLPHFHDMGLIGGLLQPLYVGGLCILMSPASFVQKPIRWLKAITEFKANVAGGPNFCFELCCTRIKEEHKVGLDLSSLAVTFTGAEPIRARSLTRFSEHFKSHGFNETSFFPCYGLAESTLFVTGAERGQGAKTLALAKSKLENNIVELAASNESDVVELVSCGHAYAGTHVIIHPPGATIGEIRVCGKSVGRGYYQRPEESQKIFGDIPDGMDSPYLHTGDLGFFYKNELFITGRLKDLIIIRGRNIYPQDIEDCAERVSDFIAKSSSAAFGVEKDGLEEIAILVELTREGWRMPDKEALISNIKKKLIEEFDAPVSIIRLLRPGELPRTTSGKVRRSQCRLLALNNTLQPSEDEVTA